MIQLCLNYVHIWKWSPTYWSIKSTLLSFLSSWEGENMFLNCPTLQFSTNILKTSFLLTRTITYMNKNIRLFFYNIRATDWLAIRANSVQCIKHNSYSSLKINIETENRDLGYWPLGYNLPIYLSLSIYLSSSISFLYRSIYLIVSAFSIDLSI